MSVYTILYYTILYTLYRSCWLELTDLCVSEKLALPTWQEVRPSDNTSSSSDREVAKVMYACFLVHAYLEKHCGDLAMQVKGIFTHS